MSNQVANPPKQPQQQKPPVVRRDPPPVRQRPVMATIGGDTMNQRGCPYGEDGMW